MDPLTIAAGVGTVATVAGVGGGLRLRQRLRRAERAVARLHRELQVERHAASHDSLTGLPNRRAFQQLGGALVADPATPAAACVMVDLNSFKYINDTLGHAAGDEVLVTVAGRLATYAGDNPVARLGGDEFAGLFTGSVTRWWPGQPAATGLATLLTAPMAVAGRRLRVTAAVGVAPVYAGAGLPAALHDADCAMYRAKATGASVVFFDPALDQETIGRPEPPPVGPVGPVGPVEDRADPRRQLAGAARWTDRTPGVAE